MAGRPPIRVLLADGAAIARDTLAEVVSSERDLELVGVAADAHDTVLHAARLRPDVALVDLRLPGGAITATRAISEASPRTTIIGISAAVSEPAETRPELRVAELLDKADAAAIVAAIRRARRATD